MATIFDLNKSISQMVIEEALELIKGLRFSRRTKKATTKTKKTTTPRAPKTPKNPKDILMSMTKEQKLALAAMLEEGLK